MLANRKCETEPASAADALVGQAGSGPRRQPPP